MDPVKDAFSKVRQDIDSLTSEILSIRESLDQTREELVKICEIILNLDQKITKISENSQNHSSAHNVLNSTSSTDIQTDSAHNSPPQALKGQNNVFSSGNRGVPTDRQTHQQTGEYPLKGDIYRENSFPHYSSYPLFPSSNRVFLPQNPPQNPTQPLFEEKLPNSSNSIDNAARILDSLDGIKKEIRLKFKRLTAQEMTVFSTIYQLEEEGNELDYKALSLKLGLTESSVRDYVGKLIKKGIPVEKKKINNKTIVLSVSTNLKKIASLSTILQLRDL